MTRALRSISALDGVSNGVPRKACPDGHEYCLGGLGCHATGCHALAGRQSHGPIPLSGPARQSPLDVVYRARECARAGSGARVRCDRSPPRKACLRRRARNGMRACDLRVSAPTACLEGRAQSGMSARGLQSPLRTAYSSRHECIAGPGARVRRVRPPP